MEKKRPAVQAVIFICMSLISLSFLYPLFFMLINSFKTKVLYYTYPFSIPLASDAIFENYQVMIGSFKIFRLFKNTAIIVIVSGVLLTIFAIFASYGFAKLDFKGKRPIYMGMLATMVIPGQVTMIPMYIMYSKVGLINNHWSVITIYLGTFVAGNILLMTSFFKGISGEMLEAAKIDGCGYFNTVRNVIIPMGIPAIMINIIFNAVGMWNDLLTPMIFLTKDKYRTVMPALANLIQGGQRASEPTLQMAGLLLSSLPMILVYLVFQRYIVKGITMGSIK